MGGEGAEESASRLRRPTSYTGSDIRGRRRYGEIPQRGCKGLPASGRVNVIGISCVSGNWIHVVIAR